MLTEAVYQSEAPASWYVGVMDYTQSPPGRWWLRDPNMPELVQQCFCNCGCAARLAAMASYDIWADEISEIESHGFKQAKNGYVATTGKVEDLPAVIRVARTRAYTRFEARKEGVEKARSEFLLLDHWGSLILNEAEHLKHAALRMYFREKAADERSQRQSVGRRPRK